jgi:hypothetical protein
MAASAEGDSAGIPPKMTLDTTATREVFGMQFTPSISGLAGTPGMSGDAHSGYRHSRVTSGPSWWRRCAPPRRRSRCRPRSRPGRRSLRMATVALRWSGSASPTLPPSRPAFDGIKRMLLLRPPQRPGSRHDLVPAPDAAAAAGVRHVVWVPSSPAAVQPAQIVRDRAAVSGVFRGVTCASASRSALSSASRARVEVTGGPLVRSS